MKKTLLSLALFAALFALSDAAMASTACYDWDCDPTTYICDFDASCSNFGGGQIWRYRWDFGDGAAGYTFTGSPTISHEFNTPYPWVTLTLIMWSGTDDDATCQIVVWNNVGPPLATYGTCQ